KEQRQAAFGQVGKYRGVAVGVQASLFAAVAAPPPRHQGVVAEFTGALVVAGIQPAVCQDRAAHAVAQRKVDQAAAVFAAVYLGQGGGVGIVDKKAGVGQEAAEIFGLHIVQPQHMGGGQ